MNNPNHPHFSDEAFSQLVNQHLLIGVAIVHPRSFDILHYNKHFFTRCVGQSTGSELNISSIIPNLNIEILEKSLGRNSIYRISAVFKDGQNPLPVDFTFTAITIEGQNYVLIQGQDNPQSLEFKNMINSYDAIFKAQTKELNEEKEKSQQADEFKSQFMARIGRELRTPMNAILGFAQLQEIQLKGYDKALQNNQQILDSGYDMVELLDKMYAFVDTQNPTGNMTIKACSILQHLTEATKLVNQHVRQHHVIVDIPTKDIKVKADSDKLTRILQEIISNGIKFNYPGGQVNIDLIENPDNTIELVFRDSATNIEDDEIEQILTPFFRSQYAKTNEISGIGIGLVLAKRLASIMNANLHISKDTEKGGIIVYLNIEKARGRST